MSVVKEILKLDLVYQEILITSTADSISERIRTYIPMDIVLDSEHSCHVCLVDIIYFYDLVMSIISENDYAINYGIISSNIYIYI